MRIPWKPVIDQHSSQNLPLAAEHGKVNFDHKGLVSIFFDIYLTMFAQEDLKKDPRSALTGGLLMKA